MHDIFTQAIALLTTIPGDLVYHLVVLFSIQAIVGLAIARVRRSGWSAPLRHIAVTGLVLLLGRVALLVVALLAQQGIPPNVALASAVTPPLERAIDLISLGFLAWALVPLLRDRGQLGLGLLIVNTLAALVAYGLLANTWYVQSQATQAIYANSLQDTIWQTWSLAIAALAALAALFSRQNRSGAVLGGFLLLVLGHILQLADPILTIHVAAWVRFTQLAAFPLFAVAVYQLTSIEVPAPVAAPVSIEPPAPSEFNFDDPLWQTSHAMHALMERGDLSGKLQTIAVQLATAFKADLAAIGLRDGGTNSIELAAIHHPGAAPSVGARFALDRQPALQRAFERHRTIIISKSEPAPELAEVFGLLGSFVNSSLLVAPLFDEDEALGVALLGAPAGDREWNAVDVQRSEVLTQQLSATLAVVLHNRQLSAEARDYDQAVRRIETEANQRRATLEAALRQTQDEAQRASIRLASLASLQEELAAQRKAEEARRQQEQQAVIDERAQLAEARAKVEQVAQDRYNEIARLTQLQNKLESELKTARDKINSLLATREQRELTPDELSHQQEVITSIVQELRTPMTSIRGYTDLLLGESAGILGAMQRQFLQRVKANTERMDGMLNDLIGLTAIDTGVLKIEPEPVDVAQIIEDTVMASEALLRERELEVQIELSDQLPPLHADRDSLHQIMKHLISNAALCSPNNSKVVVRAQVPTDMSDFLLFSVTDHGGGIAPEDRQRAFHRMYRADHPLIQGLGETGIGLSISKALVEAQGGRIWVDSDMGVGSTFTFVLPISTNHAEAAAQS